MRPQQRVYHASIPGVRGRIVLVDECHALIRWDGYQSECLIPLKDLALKPITLTSRKSEAEREQP